MKETPLGQDVGHIGPSAWKNLFRIQDNQCGGNGQINGMYIRTCTIKFVWKCIIL